MEGLTKKEKVSHIRKMVATDITWTRRAILALYEHQTDDEKNSELTKENNSRGFNSFDATFLSSIAKQLLAGRRLSEKQLVASRKALRKYSGQLLRIAEAKVMGVR